MTTELKKRTDRARVAVLTGTLAFVCLAVHPVPINAAEPSGGPCPASTLASQDLPAVEYARCAHRLLDVPVDAATVSTDALYDGFSALWYRGSTRPSAVDVEVLRLFVRELEARRAMRPRERRWLVEILLKNGRIEDADAAKEQVASKRSLVLPRLEPLASPTDPTLARYWVWDTDANVLREKTVDLSRGAHVVVTSSIGCHFCNELATALPGDAALLKAFRQHAIWISRPDGGFDLKEVRSWNARHPGVPLVTVFDLAAWPHPEQWATPLFYFMRDGRVVETVRGYQASRMDEIRKGFDLIGVSASGR